MSMVVEKATNLSLIHIYPEDAQFIMDNIYELGVAIARGILDYFGIPYTPDTQQNIDYLRSKYNGK